MDYNQIIDTIINIYTNKNTISVKTTESLNYVTSESVYSDVFIPAVKTSMRDGYAINIDYFDDANPTFEIISESIAGTTQDVSSLKLNHHEAIYVTTGGVVPDVCNAVVMIEDTIRDDKNFIIIKKKPVCDQWIRHVGSDVDNGELIIDKHTLIDHNKIALLLNVGKLKLNVYEKLNIGIFSSGNEVKDINESIDNSKGEIYDTNRYMICNFLKEKYNVHDLGIFDDTNGPNKLTNLLETNKFDAIVSSGGVSMGSKDFVKPIIQSKGKVFIEKTKLKPGKPLVFAKVNNTYVFALPGNPVSAMVSLTMFVQPSLQRMSGLNWKSHSYVHATLLDEITPDSHRMEFVRVYIYYSEKYKQYVAKLAHSNQNSSSILSLTKSNGLLQVYPQNSNLNIGTICKIYDLKQNDVQLYDDKLTIGILVMSDRASQGVYEDVSGPEIQTYLYKHVNSNYNIHYKVIDDTQSTIESTLKYMCDVLHCNILLTSGGTGPDLRDNTVQATTNVCHKHLPGFGEILRSRNFSHVPTSILSAQTAGIRFHYENIGTLIINLPGKPSAIVESLDIIFPSIPKCIEIINGPKFVINNV